MRVKRKVGNLHHGETVGEDARAHGVFRLFSVSLCGEESASTHFLRKSCREDTVRFSGGFDWGAIGGAHGETTH